MHPSRTATVHSMAATSRTLRALITTRLRGTLTLTANLEFPSLILADSSSLVRRIECGNQHGYAPGDHEKASRDYEMHSTCHLPTSENKSITGTRFGWNVDAGTHRVTGNTMRETPPPPCFRVPLCQK